MPSTRFVGVGQPKPVEVKPTHEARLADEKATEVEPKSVHDAKLPDGKATAVETSTTGLIAGEASRNANAAAGATPRRISAPATGTDPHSQAGSTAPAIPIARAHSTTAS